MLLEQTENSKNWSMNCTTIICTCCIVVAAVCTLLQFSFDPIQLPLSSPNNASLLDKSSIFTNWSIHEAVEDILRGFFEVFSLIFLDEKDFTVLQKYSATITCAPH